MSSILCPRCNALAADVARLTEELRLQRGASDGRERQAAEKCGISYARWGCDWPDAVATELMHFRELAVSRRAELATLKAKADALEQGNKELREENDKLSHVVKSLTWPKGDGFMPTMEKTT